MLLHDTDCELRVAVNSPLLSIEPCRLSVPLQVAEPNFSLLKVWLLANVLPFRAITSGKISASLCTVTLPFWSMIIVTGAVSDSVSPSAEAVAVAVPV